MNVLFGGHSHCEICLTLHFLLLALHHSFFSSVLPQQKLFGTKSCARRSYYKGICHTCMRTRACVHAYLLDSGSKTLIVEADTGMAVLHSEYQPSTVSLVYTVFTQYFGTSCNSKQMAVMIHHFNAIQKKQLLCWQFVEFDIMILKKIQFSLKAASGNNLCTTGTNRSVVYSKDFKRKLKITYVATIKQ